MTDGDDTPKRVDRGMKRDLAVDLAIGARIRSARVAAGVALSVLGEAIGVSYQQVQKYELGKDRVSASTLGAIAAALNVHPGSFYSDDVSASSGTASELRSARRLGEHIARLRDPTLIRRLIALVDALADAQDGRAPVGTIEADDDAPDDADP